jgi:hypothetical protein
MTGMTNDGYDVNNEGQGTKMTHNSGMGGTGSNDVRCHWAPGMFFISLFHLVFELIRLFHCFLGTTVYVCNDDVRRATVAVTLAAPTGTTASGC